MCVCFFFNHYDILEGWSASARYMRWLFSRLQVMERVSEQMESHPVNQLEDPEAIAKISAEIISLEEQV